MKNEPAFPVSEALVANEPKYQGMTLRDYFAGQALEELKIDYSELTVPVRDIPRIMAQKAYRIADAMLAERSKHEN